MSTSIVASYNDAISVSFRSDAWFNATQVASNFGKKPDNWLRTADTKEYIKAISQICDFDEKQLVSIKRGNAENGGGTWMHPKLGIPFARWLDAKFGVWCDLQIEKILHGQVQPALESPTITPSEQQTLSEIVSRRALGCEDIGKAKAEIWSRIHRKFRVAKYQQLTREQLADANAYVMEMDVKVPKEKIGAYSAPLSVWKLANKVGPVGHLTYPELQKIEGPNRPLATLLRQLANDGHDVAGAQAEYMGIKVLLDVYHWRLEMLADIFHRLDQHGHRVVQH